MASLKDLRNRIASVKATQKITKAMQMVAAAKLRRAQEAAESARPYAERMEGVLANLGRVYKSSESASPYLIGTGKDDVHLLVVATAERGLCGGFNTNIVKLAKQEIKRLIKTGKTVQILCVGSKGYDQLKGEYSNLIVGQISFKELKAMNFAKAQEVSDFVTEKFDSGDVDVVKLYFSEFQSVISQVPTELQLIPASFDEDEAEGDAEVSYEYEPSEEQILDELLPRNLTTQIFRGLLENAASEQGARMSAMDNATRNAGDMIDRLTLEYNRSRQAQITKELIEIISGAEAL
jgi:F-type H+-transporting ATPase subunit gamma